MVSLRRGEKAPLLTMARGRPRGGCDAAAAISSTVCAPSTSLIFGLMLLALALAYLVPFELLLFMPMSCFGKFPRIIRHRDLLWLHDRKLFHAAPRSGALVLAAAGRDPARLHRQRVVVRLHGIWCAFVVCVLIATTSTGLQVAILFAGAAVLTLIMYANAPWLGVIGILLPTLIGMLSLFTLIFMALGALRSRSTTFQERSGRGLCRCHCADRHRTAVGRDRDPGVRRHG